MPVVTLELTAKQDTVGQPILWRLGKLFNVVTNIRRARISEDFGQVAVNLEGSKEEVEQAMNYLHSLGLCDEGQNASLPPIRPEDTLSQPNAIAMRLTTVTDAQAHFPILYRVGKDYSVVVTIQRAAFDDEEGGYMEITLSGPLAEVQRAIAYLHTTGINVFPFQRSVTDYSNL